MNRGSLSARELAERIGRACERRPPGWTFGKLLIRAVDAKAEGASVSISGITDEALCRMLDEYLDDIESGAIEARA